MMAKNDPLKNALTKTPTERALESINEAAKEDAGLRTLIASGGDDVDLPANPDDLPEVNHDAEIDGLKAALKQKDAEIQALKLIVQRDQRKDYEPDRAQMTAVWNYAFTAGLQTIFKNGLSFWKSREKALGEELELATIRADQAVEAYIRVRRHVSPNPVEREMNQFAKAQSTNPLKNAT